MTAPARDPSRCCSVTRPTALARRYAYQVLLLEELARAGVEVLFAKEPERGGTPEDELLRQFQGMIAEYERYAASGVTLVTPTRWLCRVGGRESGQFLLTG